MRRKAVLHQVLVRGSLFFYGSDDVEGGFSIYGEMEP
jgi:hypothetical protein